MTNEQKNKWLVEKVLTEEQAREALMRCDVRLGFYGNDSTVTTEARQEIDRDILFLSTLLTRYFSMEKALKEITQLSSMNSFKADQIAQQALTGKGEGE